MKLHLPAGLRSALLTCIAALASISSTLGTAALALNSQAMGNTIEFSQGGTISNLDYADYELITVSGGTLQVDYASWWGYETQGKGFTSGNVAVGGGATLLLNGWDALGYGGEHVKQITLEGAGVDSVASMQLANKATLSTQLVLKGNTLIESMNSEGRFEAYAESEPKGSINATGANNLLSAPIELKGPLSVTVTKDAAGQGDLTISGKVSTIADGGNLSVAGDGELTLSGADSTLGAVTNNGNLVIGASMSTSAYDASGTGSLMVANGAVFTIDSLKNTEQGAMWNVITAWDADAGDTGLIVLEGGFNARTQDYLMDLNIGVAHHINGRYQVSGDMQVGLFYTESSLDVHVNKDAYLHVTGEIQLGPFAALYVNDGEMKVDGNLVLGYAGFSAPVHMYGADSSVSAGGIVIAYGGNAVRMEGGTLALGGAGIRTQNDYMADVELLGGTLVTGEGWSSEADVSVTLGAVTMGSASTGAAIFEGDITFTDTVINQNGIVKDEATLGLVLRDSTLTVRTQDLINLDAEAENEPDGDTNGLITERYWLVRNEGENAKLTLADGAVAVVGEHQYTLEADGSFVATNHQAYALNVGSGQYSAIRDIGVGVIRLNDGVTLNVDADAVEQGLRLTGSAVISTDRDTHIAGHIHHSSASDLDKNLTLNLTGTAVLSGNVNLGDGTGVLTINSGELMFGKPLSTNQANAFNTIQASEIVVESGARFSMYHACDTGGAGTFRGADGVATNVTLNGGTFYVQSMDGEPDATRTALGTLTVNGDSALDAMYCGHLAFDALSGSGKLTVAASIDGGYGRFWTTFGTLRDFDGELVTVDRVSSLNGVSKVNLNSAHQSGTNHATITGKSYSEGDFVMTGTGSLTLDDHESAGSFDVQGGKVTMVGDVVLNEGAGTLFISNGEVHFGNPIATDDVHATNTLKAAEINIGSGGKLTFYHSGDAEGAPVFQGADGAATNLTLNGGTFYVQAMGGGSPVTFGTLSVSGESVYDGKYSGLVEFDTLTGSGTLTVAESQDGNYGRLETRFGSLRDFDGAVNVHQIAACKTYINSAHQSAEKHATITGKTYSEGDFVKTGAGSLTLGDHESAGSFDVQGGLVTLVGDLVLNEGTGTLSVSQGELHFGYPLSTNEVGATNTLKVREISVGEGGRFTFYHGGDTAEKAAFQGANGASTDLTLNGGTFYVQASGDVGAGDAVTLGTLSVSGNSHLDGKYNGHVKFAVLTGSGKLTLAESLDESYGHLMTRIDAIYDFDGELVTKDRSIYFGDTRTYINSAHQSTGKHATITGKTYSMGDFVKTGAGRVTLDSHMAEGSFSVAEGEVIAATALTVAGATSVRGGTLVLGEGATFAGQGIELSGEGALQLLAASMGETVTAGTTTIAKLTETSVDYAQVRVTADTLSRMAEGASLSNADITVAEGSAYAINNVELSNTKLTVAGALTMDASSLDGAMLVEGVELNVEATGSIATLNGQVGVFSGAHSVTLGSLSALGTEGDYTMMSTSQLSGLVLAGESSFTVNLGALAEQLTDDPMLGLVFSGLRIVEETPMTLSAAEGALAASLGKYFILDGPEDLTISKVVTDGENTILYVEKAAAVPEPATATLSLLALAALAARRRRM